MEHRNRVIPTDAFERIMAFDQNQFMKTQWENFKPAKESGITFSETLQRLQVFVQPVLDAALANRVLDKRWMSKKLEWRRKIPMHGGVPDADAMTGEEMLEVLNEGLESVKTGRTYTMEEIDAMIREMN